MVFSAKSKKPGITQERTEIYRPKQASVQHDDRSTEKNPFSVGDKVFLRRPHGKCDVPWSGPHRVTAVLSNVSVQLDDDGIARHVSHIRLVPADETTSKHEDQAGTVTFEEGAADVSSPVIDGVRDITDTSQENDQRFPRRSQRERKQPVWFADYDMVS